LFLRTVQASDIHILFEMANDDIVRRNSFNQGGIPWATHETWFSEKLRDTNCHMYIAHEGDIAVGQIRLDCTEDVGLISISVSAAHRGRGHGAEMLRQLTILWEQGTFDIPWIVGQVKTDNRPSINAFRKAGFVEVVLPQYNEYWYPQPPRDPEKP